MKLPAAGFIMTRDLGDNGHELCSGVILTVGSCPITLTCKKNNNNINNNPNSPTDKEEERDNEKENFEISDD